jgi:hypothetical protein
MYTMSSRCSVLPSKALCVTEEIKFLSYSFKKRRLVKSFFETDTKKSNYSMVIYSIH